MKAEIIRVLRSPKGVNLLASWSFLAVSIPVSIGAIGAWVPESPGWLRAAAVLLAGIGGGALAGRVGDEFERWAVLRDEYAAGRRDIERLERGDW